MGAQDKQTKLARSAVLLTALTVTITPEVRATIGSYASDNSPARATRHFAVPEVTARRIKLGSHFVMSSVWDSNSIRQLCTVRGKSAKIYNIIPANIIHYTILYSLYILSNTEAHYTDSHYVSVPASYWDIEIDVIETTDNYTELHPLYSLTSLPHTAGTEPPSLPGSSPGPTSTAGKDNATVTICCLILYVLYLHGLAYTIMHGIPSVIQKRIVKITII